MKHPGRSKRVPKAGNSQRHPPSIIKSTTRAPSYATVTYTVDVGQSHAGSRIAC